MLPHLRVALVENDSGDAETLQAELAAAQWDWVDLIVAPKNGGFAYGNNLGLVTSSQATGQPKHVVLLNPDTEVRTGAIFALVEFMNANPKVGIAGPRLEEADGNDWNWAFRFPNVLSELDHGLHFGPVSRLLKNYLVPMKMGNAPTRVDWLPGAAMIVRREVFDTIGLMDEGYFLYYEETDFCLAAARAGWECWYVPAGRVMHISGHSTGVTGREAKTKRLPKYWFESRRRFFLKNFGWRYAAAADVAYTLGIALFRTRTFLERRPHPEAANLFSDVLRNSVLVPGNHRLR
jgi:N-acetylglucosaminyl-diphospho-decaprenol L-rhamnosyltransferase